MRCKYHLDQNISLIMALIAYLLIAPRQTTSCRHIGVTHAVGQETRSLVHVQTLGHKSLYSLSKVNLLFPDTHIDGPDKDNRLDLDTAEGHGSGSVGITGPPTG